MKSNTFRWIDQFVGIPVCLLLVIWHVLTIPFRVIIRGVKKKDLHSSIAVMKFLGMGSIILSAAAIRQLRAQQPQTRIIFVTFAANRRIVEMLGIADSVLCLRTNKLLFFILDTLNLMIKMRIAKVDTIIDCEFFSKFSVIVSYLSGAGVRTGYYLREIWRKSLLTNHAFFNQYKHVQENFGLLLRSLGFDFQPLEHIQLHPPGNWKEEFRRRRRYPFVIAVNVNASDIIKPEFRRWPPEYFVELCTKLLAEHDCELWFIGSKEEESYVASVIDKISSAGEFGHRSVNWAGKTNLDELVGLLQAADLLITNDSGPMHIAASLGTPVCAIFGAETPVQYAPKGPQHFLISQASLYCHPCLNVYNMKQNICVNPHKYACLRLTTPAGVLAAVERNFIDNRSTQAQRIGS